MSIMKKNGFSTKIGVGVSDIITGLYSCISILAAFEQTSKGQNMIFH